MHDVSDFSVRELGLEAADELLVAEAAVRLHVELEEHEPDLHGECRVRRATSRARRFHDRAQGPKVLARCAPLVHPATDAPDGDAVGRQSGHQARGGASRQLAIDREFLVLADRRHADLLGHIAAMARALLRGGLVGLLGRPQALTDGARDRRQALLARRCGPLWRLHGLSQALSNAAT